MPNIFAVHKPKGISSYDVIRKLKKEFPGEKIGHGGTLDPLAEGVLVIGVGRPATKSLQSVLKNTTKEYIAEIELGKVSETGDAEGPVTISNSSTKPSREEIESVLKTFIGTIMQTPPVYSAVKVKGKAAYQRTRSGEKIELEPKSVVIHSIAILEYTYPILKIKVETGSGVYIRSLARDIGERLGSGAYLAGLVRTRVGEFTLPQSRPLHDHQVF